MSALVATPVFAQGPFDPMLISLQTFFTGTLSTTIATIAIIIGGIELAFGSGRGHTAIGGTIVGVGVIMFAARIVPWLYA